MNILFLDESGDHNLSVIDPQYPLFVLGGVIVDKDYAEGQMAQAFQDFKRRVFGQDDLILHTADITRNRNGFERLKERNFREHFYEELNSLLKTLEFRVVACAIRKDEHLSRYGVAALDPYMLSLDVLVERFCMDVGNTEGGGLIVAERRDSTLDHELDIAWLNLKVQGTRFVKAKDIEKRILGLNLRAKSANIAGLQLADLVVTPIGRMALGKTIKEDYRVIESKFRRSPSGRIEGYGLVVLPQMKRASPRYAVTSPCGYFEGHSLKLQVRGGTPGDRYLGGGLRFRSLLELDCRLACHRRTTLKKIISGGQTGVDHGAIAGAQMAARHVH